MPLPVFTSPVVLFTDPALPPPQRGVGGTRALAHSIIKYVYKLYIVGDWHLELVNQCDNHLELLLSDTWGVH